MDVTKKKVSELRVVDLRHILEKRGLEKTGNKSILVERLTKVRILFEDRAALCGAIQNAFGLVNQVHFKINKK